jgi:hypothetical protein
MAFFMKQYWHELDHIAIEDRPWLSTTQELLLPSSRKRNVVRLLKTTMSALKGIRFDSLDIEWECGARKCLNAIDVMIDEIGGAKNG